MKRFFLSLLVVGMMGLGSAQASTAIPSERTPTAELLLGNMGFQLFSD